MSGQSSVFPIPFCPFAPTRLNPLLAVPLACRFCACRRNPGVADPGLVFCGYSRSRRGRRAFEGGARSKEASKNGRSHGQAAGQGHRGVGRRQCARTACRVTLQQDVPCGAAGGRARVPGLLGGAGLDPGARGGPSRQRGPVQLAHHAPAQGLRRALRPRHAGCRVRVRGGRVRQAQHAVPRRSGGESSRPVERSASVSVHFFLLSPLVLASTNPLLLSSRVG